MHDAGFLLLLETYETMARYIFTIFLWSHKFNMARLIAELKLGKRHRFNASMSTHHALLGITTG